MSDSKFDRRRLLYGEWLTETEEDRHLRELAEEYHDQCDAYDLSVCSGISPRTGEPIPINPDEYKRVNRNALQMRKSVTEKGRVFGLTEEQVHRAIQRYCK